MLGESSEGLSSKPTAVGAANSRVKQQKIPRSKAFDAEVSVRAWLDLCREQVGTVMVTWDAETGAPETIDAPAQVAIALCPLIMHEVAGE